MTQKQQKRRKPSAKAKRSAARLCAVQALYEISQTGASVDEAIQNYRMDRYRKPVEDIDFVEADLELMDKIVRGAIEKEAEIKAAVEGADDQNRLFNSYELLIQGTLLAGGYELMFDDSFDAPLIISEYVDVGRAFYNDKQPQIVNAILDKIAKTVR